MAELHCPLCDAVLAFPPGPSEPREVLAVLEGHFAEACTAIRLPRPVARVPEHREPQKHDG
jgi:hypothetical protein